MVIFKTFVMCLIPTVFIFITYRVSGIFNPESVMLTATAWIVLGALSTASWNKLAKDPVSYQECLDRFIGLQICILLGLLAPLVIWTRSRLRKGNAKPES